MTDATPVTAGECFGDAVQCETPEILAFEPGELRNCTEVDGEVRTLWKNEVSEIDCFAGRCSVALNGVATGPDGSVWASARVYAPGAFAPELVDDSEPIADAILIYDAKGARTATVIEPRTRLGHTTGWPLAHVAFDSLGRGVRLGSALGVNGLDLASYDGKGARIARTRLVEGVSVASRFAAGSRGIVVAYTKEELEVGFEPPPVVINRSGVAFFDASLNPIWNQSALPLGSVTSRALALPNPTGGLSLSMSGEPAPGGSAPSWLVHVGAHGPLEWVRLLPGFSAVALSLPDGGAVFESGVEPRAVHRVGADGRGLWRHELVNSFFEAEQLVATDGAGRVIFGKVEPQSLRVISEDGRSCARYRIPIETCVTVGNEQNCLGVTLAFGDDRTFAFSGFNVIGVATLGELP